MKCKQIQEILPEYLEGVVSEKQKKKIQQHLETCRDCSEHLRLLKKTINLVGNLPEVCAPAGFVSGVMEKIQEKHARKSRIGLWLAGIAFAEVVILFTNTSSQHPYQKEIAKQIDHRPAQQIQQKKEKLETKEEKGTTIAYREKYKQPLASANRPALDLTGIGEKRKTEIVIQLAAYKVSEVASSEKRKNANEPMPEEEKPVAKDEIQPFARSETAKSMVGSESMKAPVSASAIKQEKFSIESDIKRQISSINGKILSEQETSDTEIRRVITAEIPGSSYANLIENLREKFQIRNLTSLKDMDVSDTQITIKIEIFR